MPRTAPPVRPVPGPGIPRGPRNGLGAVTFVIVVLGALLAVFPATAAFGLLLCLFAIVPAFVAHRRTRKGTATNRGRSVAALAMAPVFLVVAIAVVAATAPPPQVTTTSDTSALAATPAAPAAVAPLLAAPAPTSTTVEGVPAADSPTSGTTTAKATRKAASTSRSTVVKAVPVHAAAAPVHSAPARQAPTHQAPTHEDAVAPAPVVQPLAAPPSSKPSPKPVAKPKPQPVAEPAPAPVEESSSATCDTDTHYVNSSGHCVPRPVAAASAPSGATYKCKDGTYSFSEHAQGTCSGHKGIAQKL